MKKQFYTISICITLLSSCSSQYYQSSISEESNSNKVNQFMSGQQVIHDKEEISHIVRGF